MRGSAIRNLVITQAIAMVCFVVMPVVITLVVPFTDLEFQRTGSTAAVSVRRYVLLFVPWRTQRVENVTEIAADVTPEFRYRDTSENRRKGVSNVTRVATGQLVILGDGPEVVVQAAPELTASVTARFERFLAANNPEPVKIPVYASWNLSWLLGGAVTFLCALYVAGSIAAVLKFLFGRNHAKG